MKDASFFFFARTGIYSPFKDRLQQKVLTRVPFLIDKLPTLNHNYNIFDH